MSLNDSLEKKKFDVRLVKNNIKRGVITEDELKNHQNKLPDEASKVEVIKMFESTGNLNDSDMH